MTKQARRGRPPVKYVDDALDVIMSSETPISTNELIKAVGISQHEGISLRRGLKRAEERGMIQRVIVCADGSFTWVPKRVSVESCACHAANLYLAREKAAVKIDPEKFEDWIRAKGYVQK